MSAPTGAPTGDQNNTPPANATPNPSNVPAQNNDWMSPEAREIVTKANNEAAQFRTQKNEAVQAHTEALAKVQELTDKNTATETERDGLKVQLSKLNAALKAGVPGEHAIAFASRLTGNTDEELEADAKNALALFSGKPANPAATDPSQARGDSNSASNLSEGGKWLQNRLKNSLS